jgi:SAM-dependent methyltransferase
MEVKKIEAFYSQLAGDYDEMTRFSHREKSESAILRKWIKHYRFHTALDAACGTGLHVILLNKLGIRTVGVDISREMLNVAKKNAEVLGFHVQFIQAPLQNLTPKINKKFDAIFCLGNSLPHILDRNELMSIFQTFKQLLNENGILALQLLNYEKILKDRNRIIAIHREKKNEYIRFYDFLNGEVSFNILKIWWQDKVPLYQLISTSLNPYIKSDLELILENCHYKNLEYFGTMDFYPFDPLKSPNLIVVAKNN